ncbi:uncharacterized protein LOC128857329 [Anastrepha ludens]|uniref:uncharacterized protein LOC128857329 n=1 Tax=Anastrepha ludens TaxID=28586 RepID=UPI0023B1CCD1|nr:uncharacterized protein LOC128857329 [Anastrepha ludens]
MDLVEQRVQYEVPNCFDGEVVYGDKLLVNRKRRCIVLARNLKLYEFCKKQLVNSIDLSKTCLKKVGKNVQDYKGPKGKWFKSIGTRSGESFGSTVKPMGLMETSELQNSVLLEEKTIANVNITFGKYVYRNFDINKVYLLIHCWDKLVVVDLPDYSFITENEGVKSFRIVHGKGKFEAMLEIQFENGESQCTDFQKHEKLVNRTSPCNIASDRNSLKQLLERARCSQAELQLHKSITQKEFDVLRDEKTFGCNYIRSDQLEEKHMISRCGDIWLRFVTNDTMVFGVPLVNNCSSNSLTILKNLKPILKINDSSVENIIYKYRLYQLQLFFEDLDTMETFFQIEDEELRTAAQPWVNCELPQLLPASFAVLLIGIKTSQILLVEDCPLLLYFEVEKDLPRRHGHHMKTVIYEQHLFLKSLKISHILLNRGKHELNFSSPSCHQDFLATAFINKEATLRIQFASVPNASIFEQLIAEKFNFNKVERKLTPHGYKANNENASKSEQVEDKLIRKPFVLSIFFNKDPTSLWFGSMILQTISDVEDIQTWKLYLYNKEKTFVCLKLLFNELMMVNCQIKHMEYFDKTHDTTDSSFLKIKNALIGEYESLKHLNDRTDAGEKKKMFEKLMKAQINSDILVTSVT